jgi:hypothetical protein
MQLTCAAYKTLRIIEERVAQWRDAALIQSTSLHLELQQALKHFVWKLCAKEN